ncbi:hypothetical protein H920_09677 [Fukomys damarensis]|uniref:Uncharacterized protein n=1 Tax=Fukomys damarensis TaxID=885580 RepID=A0A091E113_FUKDA|nr:hypothetical protein H920_09677 [Fukomys damarensis]
MVKEATKNKKGLPKRSAEDLLEDSSESAKEAADPRGRRRRPQRSPEPVASSVSRGALLYACCCLGATGEAVHGLQTGTSSLTTDFPPPLVSPTLRQALKTDLAFTSRSLHPYEISQGHVLHSLG